MNNFLEIGQYKLKKLGKINVILGKNGCGKSILLREIDKSLSGKNDVGIIKYIPPERGRELISNSNIEDTISNSHDWLPQVRRKNLCSDFRQQSMSQFNRLKTLVLEEIEHDKSLRSDPAYTFNPKFSS